MISKMAVYVEACMYLEPFPATAAWGMLEEVPNLHLDVSDVEATI